MLDRLFENAGAKIMRYAKIAFIVEIVAAVIAFIGLCADNEEMFLPGILGVVVAVGVAYLASLAMSAFGELVQSTTDNKNINAQILMHLNNR